MSYNFVGDYILISYNKVESVERVQPRILVLRAGYKPDLIHIHVRIFNTMNGGAIFNMETSELKGRLSCTHMLGHRFDMMVEKALVQGFANGMILNRDGDTLILNSGEDKLIFRDQSVQLV